MSVTRRFVLGSLLAGCTPLHDLSVLDPGDPPGDPDALRIRYFSVGCALITWRGRAVLTDPFFSHLSWNQVVHGDTLADPAQVAPYLPLLGDVRAVVVGHGHYDHVLGIPAVDAHLHPSARTFCSRTVAHTFAPNGLRTPLVDVNPHRATQEQPGTWLAADGIRVLPIASGHPDNVPGIHFFTKRLTEDRTTAPRRVSDYQEGETLAFLIDFLDGDRIARRVYVQTSSRGWPDGFVPPDVLAARRPDAALLAMDCANITAGGRYGVVDLLRPGVVVGVHWEDFFRTKEQAPHQINKVNLPRLAAALSDHRVRWRFPAWDSEIVVP